VIVAIVDSYVNRDRCNVFTEVLSWQLELSVY